jgi:hypothetical protein
MPAKIAGIMNDGYQIFVELPGDNNAKKNMYCLLSACAILTEAESTEALPESIRNTILELDGEDFKDVSAVNLLMYKCTILQEQGRYEAPAKDDKAFYPSSTEIRGVKGSSRQDRGAAYHTS